MKKLTIITSTIATGLLITILTGCNIIHKPDINGSDRQPIMHGWTFEQAGEFWLQSDLDGERIEATSNGKPWMTAEELASFDDEHVQVKLPIAPEGTNPLPRNGIAYSQEGTGGFIKFNINPEAIAKDTILRAALTDAKLTAEQLMTVGYADIHLQEPLYFNEDSTFCCYVQQRNSPFKCGSHLCLSRCRQPLHLSWQHARS